MTVGAVDRDRLLGDVSLFELLVERGSEPRRGAMSCPLPDHEDTHPSASYTEADSAGPERWYCHVCAVGGTAVDLLCYADGLSVRDAFVRLEALAGGAEAPAPRPRGRLDDLSVAGWAHALEHDDATLLRLSQLRGWAPDVLRRFGVGVHQPKPGVCSHQDARVSFPVRGSDGQLIGLVCYQPRADRRRGAPKSKAHGQRGLFPRPEDVEPVDGWMVLCEGEPDALCGASLGMPCVGAPGVGKWDAAWPARFEGRRVLVIGDCDADGRRWARATAGRLVEAAEEVRVAELDPSRDDGYDLTDWAADQRDLWGGDPSAALSAFTALREAGERIVLDAPQRPFPAAVEVRASALAAGATDWLWDGRVPLGSVTALAGRQGTGKSLVSCELAARLSRGELAGHLSGRSAATVMVSYEDNLRQTVIPRLHAASADTDQVYLVDGAAVLTDRNLTLPSHNGLLEDVIRRHEAKLLVVDPIGSALDPGVNSHREADVRSALAPLAALAAACEVAVVLVMHRRKGYADEPLDAVMGSQGFTAAARSVLLFGQDPDESEGASRVLAHAKNNLGPLQASLRMRIEPVTLAGADDGVDVDTARIEVTGESPHDAHALTRESRARKGEPLQDACALLEEMLSDGPRAAVEVSTRAGAEGISAKTLKRARSALGVRASKRTGEFDGGWMLTLPERAGVPLF